MKRVHIVPWQNDLLEALAELLLDESGGDLSQCLVVFPHRRPRRHLLARLAAMPRLAGRPFLPPAVLAMNELFIRLRQTLEGDEPPRKSVNNLDQAHLLRQECLALQRDEGQLAGLPVDDDRLFFPWGLRLAALMEESFREDRPLMDLPFLEGEVQPFAAALLEQLGRIQRGYRETLDRLALTTQGYDVWRLARRMDEALEALRDQDIYFTGFIRMTGPEEALADGLLEGGRARLLLRADPAMADPGAKAHWSCQGLAELAQRLEARPTLLDVRAETGPPPRPRLTFHEGHDLHSQLHALRQDLERIQAESGMRGAAVILPDTGLLQPVLHHIPEAVPRREINISMGYPLTRSPLAELLETLLTLQETSRPGPGARRYAWRGLVALVRHPYLKMLEVEDRQPLRPLFRELEKDIRDGVKHQDPRGWRPETLRGQEERLRPTEGMIPSGRPIGTGMLGPGVNTRPEHARPIEGVWEGSSPPAAGGVLPTPAALALLDRVLDVCLGGFEGLRTPTDLAEALERLCRLLLDHGMELWRRFPIDGECLHRLRHQIIPALRLSLLRDETMERETLFALLRELFKAERAPFDAEPLDGLNILGFLETRALRFSRLLVLDVVESQFPGPPPADPLLPESLRPILGLPDSRDMELAMALQFFGLVHGAEEVSLYYRAGGQGSGLLEEQQLRSRFIEELLFEEERRQGRLLPAEAEGSPLRLIQFPIRGLSRQPRAITKTQAIARKIEEFLSKPISPTRLESYLRCPLQFFYEQLTPLEEVAEVLEEEDHRELGTIMHSVLNTAFRPLLGRPVSRAELPDLGVRWEELADEFNKLLDASGVFRTLSYERRLGLEMAGRERLRRYLTKSFPDATTIVELETEAQAVARGRSRDYMLAGRLDRVDEREDGLVVLDYKTGWVPERFPNLWTDDELWARVEAWRASDPAPELMAELSAKLPSLQLVCYLHLTRERTPAPWNAALIELRKNGEEKPLWSDKVDADVRALALEERIPRLLGLLLDHLAGTEAFLPGDAGGGCAWCAYKGLCSKQS